MGEAPYNRYGIIREYEDDTGESQPDARSAKGCDSPCRIRVRALWLHFWHAQIRRQIAAIYMWTETSAEITAF